VVDTADGEECFPDIEESIKKNATERNLED